MRLIALIVVALLAVAAGILVISTSQAVASGARILPSSAIEGHAHVSHVHADVDREQGARTAAHDHASTRTDCGSARTGCGDPASGTQGGVGADCCGMGACHAVQALAVSMLHSPYTSAAVIVGVGDEQVAGIGPGGLDRPPRPV